MAHGQGGAEIGFDHGPTLTCNHEAPIVAHTLKGEGFDASEDGTGRGIPLVPVAFDCKGSEAASDTSGATPTLRAMGHAGSHANAGGQLAVAHAFAIQERAVAENPNAGSDGAGVRTDGAAYTLEARTVPQAVAFDAQAGGKTGFAISDVAGALHGGGKHGGRSSVATRWAVRRLTPLECDRLQGFEDDYTRVPYRGRPAAKCPDGPRYKALGNSMAVNCMEWIGRRIDLVRAVMAEDGGRHGS